MTELATPLLPQPGAAGAMTRESARLARRLAELLTGFGDGDAHILDARRFLERAVAAAPPAGKADALDRLVEGLGLSRLERELVLLASLPDEHEGFASVLRLLGPQGEPYASVGLATQLLCADDNERAALRETVECGRAVASGAIRVEGDAPFFERTLRLADGLSSVLRGIDALPPGIAAQPVCPPLGGLESWLGSVQAGRARRALATDERCTVLVAGDAESVAAGRALALAHAAEREALVLEAAPTDAAVRLLVLHALARDAVPVVVVPAADGPNVAAPALPALDLHPGAALVAARTGGAAIRGSRPLLAVAAAPLDPSARRRMWEAALPELGDDAALLATRHALEPAGAADVAADVRSLEQLDGRRAGVDDVAAAVRARAGVWLSGGVRLVHPAAGWDRLVLSDDRLEQLREAVDRLAHQARVLDDWGFLAGRSGARGVRMLFAGPPGTGKTLSAEVLAHALGVDLLVVDISRVVSKWIGETEKNLAEVFEAAERAQAVLLFDEADALFGRRTEVSDAHDRYANLETAYLLARLERFEGLAILSTNLRQNIDPAFTRRLEFVVEYDEPDTAEREALWRCHLPERAPIAPDVDVAELAGLYAVVGGLIRNAAVAAGFLAAAEEAPIRREHLLRSLAREYEKAGRAFPGVPIPAHAH